MQTSVQGIYQFSSASIRLGSTSFRQTQLESRGTLQVRRAGGGLRTELVMPNDRKLTGGPIHPQRLSSDRQGCNVADSQYR